MVGLLLLIIIYLLLTQGNSVYIINPKDKGWDDYYD